LSVPFVSLAGNRTRQDIPSLQASKHQLNHHNRIFKLRMTPTWLCRPSQQARASQNEIDHLQAWAAANDLLS